MTTKPKPGKRCSNYIYPLVYWLLMLLCNVSISYFLAKTNLRFFNNNTDPDNDKVYCKIDDAECLVVAWVKWAVF